MKTDHRIAPTTYVPTTTGGPTNFRLSTSSFYRKLAVMTLTEQMTQLGRQAKAASRQLAKLTTAEKNACLLAMADALEQNKAAIKKANASDMEAGAKSGLSAAMLDRLKLDDKRIAGMAKVCAKSRRCLIRLEKFSTNARVQTV